MKHDPTRWAKAARMIVDYSVVILRSERLGFERLLNSQRGSIYWILDDALLHLCLDRWGNAQALMPWDEATVPVILALSEAGRAEHVETPDRQCRVCEKSYE
jgi:hypothetical protein